MCTSIYFSRFFSHCVNCTLTVGPERFLFLSHLLRRLSRENWTFPLTTNQFVAHWHHGVVCQKGQLLHSQLVTSDLPSNRRPWVALAIQEHAYYMHAPPHVSLGEQHSILGKLCLLFSAMLDHLTCLCCYVTAASPLWTVRAEQPES